jgi:hypothetical protein
MDTAAAPPAPRALRRSPVIRTQRVLQVVLGLLWVLDAALQFQPYMFGRGFVDDFILANASGQPTVVSWVITNVGHFLAPHIALWNTLFALVQVAIGVGLLVPRTVRPALALSFAWVLGVWVFGEGLGMVLTGSATALTGAPGSVLLYGLIGLCAWPRRTDGGTDWSTHTKPVGSASSAAGSGLGGGVTPLAIWSGYWVLAAVLFLLPDNRTRTSVSSAIIGMAPGSPGWFAHLLNSVGHFFRSDGTQSAWVLAVVSLVVGLGPLVVRRSGLFLLAGGVLSALLWITGQGLLGGILTGSGTDPNTGPLLILLALAMVPTALADRAAWRSPFSSLARWNPVVAWGGVGTVGLALFLSAAYPVAAAETASTAMAGMTGMAGSSSARSSANTCTQGNGGLARTGLNVNNTPYMIMGGHNLGMDMNGSDATAAAGLNTTKANWDYTGPALPSALANELLADGGNGPDDLRMAVSGCAPAPTASQEINAVQYVQATSQQVARFSDPLAALAAGYVAASPTNYPITYFVNPAIVAANAAAKRTLNPDDIDGLVYARTPSGTEVLAAAVYVLPATVAKVPMPFGPLVQWHQRTDVCGPVNETNPATLNITGLVPCAAGTALRATPFLTMVWQLPVAGGPLAIQPPDIQIVEAAIMSTTAS